MYRITTTIFLSALLFAAVPENVQARDLGRHGAVYPVAEPDALAEMRKKAAGVDWQKILNREKMTRKVRDYRPKDLARLPSARRERAFLTDMS